MDGNSAMGTIDGTRASGEWAMAENIQPQSVGQRYMWAIFDIGVLILSLRLCSG